MPLTLLNLLVLSLPRRSSERRRGVDLPRNLIDRLGSSMVSLLLLVSASSSPAAQSAWVYYDGAGHLAYQTWTNGNRIMDFSDAGYMGGGVALPTVPTVLTLNPSGGDDKTALQNALNAVSAMPLTNGFRGALQLGSGTFLVSGQLNLTASGVIIRGTGSAAGGTTIQMTSGSTMTLFNVSGSASPSESGTVNMTDSYVPSGTKTFNVSSAASFNIGDTVNIHRIVTSNWVHYLGMDTLVRNGATQTWLSAGTVITTDRTIKQVSGNQITLDVPLTDSFDSQYLGTPVGTMSKYSWSGRISQVGLEHFRILAPPVADAYISVHMNNLIDSWARDIVIQDGVNCFTLDKATKRVTLDHVVITHTVPSTNAAGPSDFACTGTQIFYNKCQTYGTGSWPFVTHVTGTGPIVILNFYSTQAAGISPHQRWCTGILSDNCSLPNAPAGTQGIAYRNRGTAGSGHGWTTGWSVAWNVTTPYFLVSAAPGTENWCIGGVGAHTTHSPDPDGIYDSLGAPVTLGATGSLYLEQLRERLGDAALANIGYGAPDFTVATAPAAQTVLNGGSTNFNVTIAAIGNFTNSVILSVSGLPAEAGFSFNPPSITGSGSSTLMVTTSNSTPAGTYPLIISGAGGGVSHTGAVSLTVMNFRVSAAPASQNITAGNNTSYTVSVNTNNGFSGPISFGLTGLPAFSGAGFSPPTLSGNGSTALTVTTTSNAPAGSYTLAIFATNAAGVASTAAALLVSGLQANPGTLLWSPAGADTNWSTVLNWTNQSAGGFGPPTSNNAVLYLNNGAINASALTAPGSGVVVPSQINTFANGSFTVTALTNLANAPTTSPVFHNIAILNGATLKVTGITQVGGFVGADFGANNVTVLTISGSGAALQQNGSLTISQNSGSTGSHTAVLDMSGLDTFTMNASQIRLGVEGGGSARRASGFLYLAKTNSLTLTSAWYSDTTGAGSPFSGNPGLYIGHNTSSFGIGSQLYLGINNSIFMDYATIGRGETNALMAFNPAFLSLNPSVLIRGTDGGATRVGVYVVGDGSAGSVANNAPSTNDFTGGTVDALINYLCVGRGRTASSTIGGSGILSFSAGTINANTLVIGLVYPTGLNSPASGTINVNGSATLIVNSNLFLAQSPNLAGQTAFPQGTLNINGGTVQATNVAGAGGVSTINLNSGILDLQGVNPVPGNLANVSSLNIGDGSANSALLQNAATILVSNTITIAANGTLAGNTVITSPALVVNGTISPGTDGIGSITNHGLLTFGPGGHFTADIQHATGSPVSAWDFLQTTGALDVEATSANPFTIDLQSLDAGGPGLVSDFDPNHNYDWVIATAAGGISNFDANAFTVNTALFQNDPGNGYFYLRTEVNSLLLSFTNPPPAGPLLSITTSGANLVLTATGGAPGNTCYVLSSTNVGLPLTQWPRIATNSFDSNGNFIFTTPRVLGAPKAFYRLQMLSGQSPRNRGATVRERR
jgi:hypothetical protein